MWQSAMKNAVKRIIAKVWGSGRRLICKKRYTLKELQDRCAARSFKHAFTTDYGDDGILCHSASYPSSRSFGDQLGTKYKAKLWKKHIKRLICDAREMFSWK